MKTIILIACLSLTITAPLLAYDTNVLSNDQLRFSYAEGMMIGTSWRLGGLDLDDKMVLRAVKDVEAGGRALMTQQEMGAALSQLQQEMAAKGKEPSKEVSEQNTNKYNSVLSNNRLRFSYAMGMLIANHWKQEGVDLDNKMVFRAVKDAEAGGTKVMSNPEISDALFQLRKQSIAKQEEHQKELAKKNKKVGDAFLAKNKQKNGVMTFPDGLQYKILVEGNGLSPSTNDLVTVNYEGTFIDGAKLESADKKQLPAGSVIRGWTEALIHMRVGSKWQLFIPPDLAYGQYGRPPRVGPNATLIFTIELVSIEHPQPITSDIIKVPSAEEMKNGAKVEIIKPEDFQKAQQSAQPAK